MTEQLKQVWDGKLESFLSEFAPKCKPRIKFRGACQERPFLSFIVPEVEVVMPAWLAKLVLGFKPESLREKLMAKLLGIRAETGGWSRELSREHEK